MTLSSVQERGRLQSSIKSTRNSPKRISRSIFLLNTFAAAALLGAGSAQAANYYVTQSGAGSGNGTSQANAWSVAAFNASSTPTGGDTVFFSGTITSSVKPTKNGTGNGTGRLTLDFSGATLTAPTPRISLSGRSYLNINGGTMGSTTSGDCISFGGGQAHDITIQNWKQTADSNNTGAFISGNYCYNLLVANNNLTNTRCVIQGDSILNHDLTIANNYAITSTNTTAQTDLIFLGDAYNVTIEGNKLVQRAEGATSGRHNDIIQTYQKGGSNAGAPGGWIVRYNWMELDVRGGSGDTSWMMMENMNNRSGADAIKIYGNVFYGASTDSASNNGICFGYNASTAVVRFYNNTVVRKNGPDNTIRFRSPGIIYAQNNVGYGSKSGTYLVWTMTNMKIGNNWFYNFGATSAQTGSGGGTSDPQFTDYAANNFSLKSTSPLIGKGDSSIGTEYNRGIAANATWPNPALSTRSPWDIGAYVSGSGATPPPADTTPPSVTSLKAAPTATGATITWATNEPSTSKVEYGVSTSYGSVQADTNPVTAHSINISGLAAGTTYHYRVQSADATGNVATSADGTFATPAAPVSGQVAVQPSSLSFGQVALNSSADLTLTVKNSGGTSISGNASVAAPFSIVSGGSYTLAGGQSQAVTVRYRPTVAGTNTGSVVFTGGSGVTVPVTGSGASTSTSLSTEAEAGTLSGPFVASNGAISQSTQTTDVASSGRASFKVTVPEAGKYTVVVSLSAPSEASNSLFFNIDAEPQDPTMIWDIPVTKSTFEDRTGGWRGSGTPEQNQFTPKYFDLTAGTHELIIRGREANVKIDKVSLVKESTTSPTTPTSPTPQVIEAESGTLKAPFVASNGAISQSTQTTDVASSGRASFKVTAPEAGQYAVVVTLSAPSEASNSLFFNIDAEPQDPTMVWDIPVTKSTFEDRTGGWRGSGTPEQNQFTPKYFDLTAGTHELIIRGREANVKIDKVSLVKRPSTPEVLSAN